ncbi:FHA domain-containing protein [Clostridium sp. NSJ-6]|uniref:FHA domain-containing protein n=1 Tax=Clostridium hominis TaxID=2763036 RepID=A0ABR7DFZ4_9CLOT|nr:FHA domain-containing protein [Clostridium hominis]MBC5630339.1 FHA domain-containing protein [Clostridium hominis]MDU2673258.1 FHA domain-containing protein [Clostridium sp.]
MNISKLITFASGIVFIIILYLIIYYALKIMYKDVKTGGKKNTNPNLNKYGLEITKAGGNEDLEEESVMLIRGDVTIGRMDDNSIILSEPFVSGHHARVYAKNNTLYIEDLNSTNGIYVNEEKVEGKIKLTTGDEIKIGSAIFTVLRADKL